MDRATTVELLEMIVTQRMVNTSILSCLIELANVDEHAISKIYVESLRKAFDANVKNGELLEKMIGRHKGGASGE